MGGESLGTVKVKCSSVEGCQDREAGMGRLVCNGRGREGCCCNCVK